MTEKEKIEKVKPTLAEFLTKEETEKQLKKIVGDKTRQFISSLISLVEGEYKLKQCRYEDLIRTCLKAVALDLPIDNNLGYCFVIPYDIKNVGVKPMLQIGYKGFIQLALRTQKYTRINVAELHEGELKKYDPITEEIQYEILPDREQRPITHYVAFFEMTNGYKKMLVMTKEELLKHGKRFSKTFELGPWQTDTDEMCKKTILKKLLSKYGFLTAELQQAIKYDQAIIEEKKGKEEVIYVDNPETKKVVEVKVKEPKQIKKEVKNE
jgi:recombination protein RecT